MQTNKPYGIFHIVQNVMLCVIELKNKNNNKKIQTMKKRTTVQGSEGLVMGKALSFQRINELLGTCLAVHSL